MKKAISFITLLLISGLAFSQAGKDPNAKKILDKVNAKYSDTEAFTAKITYKLEVTSNPSLNESFTANIKNKGDKFYVKKSDGEQYYCNGVAIWNIIECEGTISEFDPEENPINFEEIVSSYKNGYKYIKKANETVGGVSCAVIDMEPEKNEDSDVFKIRLLIDEKTNEVKQWIVFERNGNRHKIKIDNFKTGVSLADSEFEYKKAANSCVVLEDLR